MTHQNVLETVFNNLKVNLSQSLIARLPLISLEMRIMVLRFF